MGLVHSSHHQLYIPLDRFHFIAFNFSNCFIRIFYFILLLNYIKYTIPNIKQNFYVHLHACIQFLTKWNKTFMFCHCTSGQIIINQISDKNDCGFSAGTSGKEPYCQRRLDIRDSGLILGSGRSPGGGQSNPPQYFPWSISWTEKAGGLQSTWSQSGTWLKWFSVHPHM